MSKRVICPRFVFNQLMGHWSITYMQNMMEKIHPFQSNDDLKLVLIFSVLITFEKCYFSTWQQGKNLATLTSVNSVRVGANIRLYNHEVRLFKISINLRYRFVEKCTYFHAKICEIGVLFCPIQLKTRMCRNHGNRQMLNF